MPSSGMLHCVALVRTEFRMNVSEISVLTSATQRNVPEDGILQTLSLQ
jgi:hypothetical protein